MPGLRHRRAGPGALSLGQCTLRSHSWDGPAPAEGDLLVSTGGSWYLVLAVAAGAGLGHYRLDCSRMGKTRPMAADLPDATIWRWRWAPRHRRL